MEKIVRLLLTAANERKVLAPLHCTGGYKIAEDLLLRCREPKGPPVWLGCLAGIHALAITPGGSIKACTTLWECVKPELFIVSRDRSKFLPLLPQCFFPKLGCIGVRGRICVGARTRALLSLGSLPTAVLKRKKLFLMAMDSLSADKALFMGFWVWVDFGPET